MTVKFVQLALDDLVDVGDNIRTDLGDLTDLAASLKAQGMMQPIVVDAENRIVSGHRRHAAAVLAGLDEVPVIVNDEIDDVTRLEMMIVENLQRKQLSPLEEAEAFNRLVAFGHSQRRIADRIGCAQAHVSRRIALLALPPAAHKLIEAGELTLDDALVLARATPEHLAGLFAGGVERWQIVQAVSTVRRREETEAARAKAAKSGLPEAKDYDYRLFEPADEDTATHWAVRGETIIWLRQREAAYTGADDLEDEPEFDVDADDRPQRDTGRIADPEQEARMVAYRRRQAVATALAESAGDRKAFAKAWLANPKNWTAGAKAKAATEYVVHVMALLASNDGIYADIDDVCALVGVETLDDLAAIDITAPEDRLRMALAAALTMGEGGVSGYGRSQEAGGAHLLFLAAAGRPITPVEQAAVIEGLDYSSIDLEAVAG